VERLIASKTTTDLIYNYIYISGHTRSKNKSEKESEGKLGERANQTTTVNIASTSCRVGRPPRTRKTERGQSGLAIIIADPPGGGRITSRTRVRDNTFPNNIQTQPTLIPREGWQAPGEVSGRMGSF